MMKIARLFLTLIFFAPMFVLGQSKISPYTAEFISSIKEVKNLKVGSERISAKFSIEEFDSKKYVKAFIAIDNSKLSILNKYEVKVNTVLSNIVTAQIPIDRITDIAALAEVRYIEIAEPVTLQMDSARAQTNVNQVHKGLGLERAFTGKNVVVGVIDFGLKYAHINFYTEKGTDLRVKRVWNQNDKSGNTPQYFDYGSEYDTPKKMIEADFDSSITSHGTHVTGIAAGAYQNTKDKYQGVAPEADIVLVSLSNDGTKSTTVSALDGLNYIFKYADSVDKPCVVNMSLGAPNGPHDGTSLFDQACDQLQGAGRLLVGSAGNEGGNKLHVTKNLQSETDTLKTFYTSKSGFSLKVGTTLWGESGKNFKLQIQTYNTKTNQVYFKSDWFDTTAESSKKYPVYKDEHHANGSVSIQGGINPLNNRPYVQVSPNLASFSSGVLVAILVVSENGIIHGWPNETGCGFSNKGLAGWIDGDTDSTIGEIGGTGKEIISVGSYTSRVSYTLLEGNTIEGDRSKLGKISNFSAKGPSLDGRMKPDITGPGDYVVSSISTRIAAPGIAEAVVNGNAYYWGLMQGTSMSAPFVTGVLATWLEANNKLTPTDIRDIFKQTAINDEMTGDIRQTGSNTWGYGKIDAWNGIKEAIRLGQAQSLNENGGDRSKNGVALYTDSNSGELKLIFLEDKSNVQVTVFAVDGTNVYSQYINQVSSSQEMAIRPRNQSLKGVYVVSVTDNKRQESHRTIIK